jgi:ABC-type Fe3+-hydroxamate transport system substrate-binding protein
MELIISLRPDLVIGSNEGLDTYSSTLRKLKINFLLIDLKRLDDYPTAVQKIADHLGMSASAKTVINDWNSSWSSIPKTRAPKDVLIQVDHNPLVISGSDTFLSDVITRCGHINVAQSKTGYPTIQIEGLAKFKPKLVLATVHSTESQKLEVSTFWKNQKIIPTPNFVQVDANDASRLGPRLAATAKSICKLMDETK